MTVTIKVNGVEHRVEEGLSLLEALRRLGYYVPSLCYDDRLSPQGSCRLCVVEVNGRLTTSCTTKVQDGMEVRTDSEQVNQVRREVLRLLAMNYPRDAYVKYPFKEFHVALSKYGVEPQGTSRPDLIDNSHPYIVVDMNRCIKCFRCVKACDEVQGYHVWRAWGRGGRIMIRPDGPDLAHSSCVSCGLCVDVCPTGALEDRSVLTYGWPDTWVKTTCPYCGVGCELEVGVKDGRIVDVRPSRTSVVNRGNLCVKGRYAWDYVYSQDRVLRPLIKVNGEWREVSWDEAISFVASRLKEILAKYGPGSVGVLVGARVTNEEEYLAGKFARVVLGTNNVDSCARVCHEPSAQGLEDMLGTGGATNTFEDIDLARTIMVVGSNTTENHPVIGNRIKMLAEQGRVKLIVVDPRRTEIAEYADYHMALRPGTDVVLFNAMANVIVSEGLIDEEFVSERVEGLEEFKEVVSNYTPEFAEKVTGVRADVIREAARIYATNKPSMILWGLGATEHVQGTEIIYQLIDLALITGNVGRPGSGLMPLRGKNNVQGTAIMGDHPKKLPGAVPLTQNIERFEKLWGVKLNPNPGLDGIEMVEAAMRGDLKALIVFGEDVVMSHPYREMTEKALSKLELLVLIDMFHNETSKYAHVFLPAASSFEKDGTFTNAERRVQRVRKVIEPLGESLPDWQIIIRLANAMGYGDYFRYSSPEDVWNEIRSAWPAVYGITYERLDKEGGLPYPTPRLDAPPVKVLHVGQFTIGKKTRLRPVAYIPSPEQPTEEYPLTLITGRTLYHFNMGSMTRRTGNQVIEPEDFIEISEDDAKALGISDGDMVRVTSRWGSTLIRARVSRRVSKGIVFATVHHPEASINRVVSPAVDRISHIPEYKVTAVRVEKAS
jgi:formate dehydrogenase major subunit